MCVADMQQHPFARLALVLRSVWRKAGRRKNHAGQALPVHGPGQCRAVDKRRADHLERPGGSAPFRKVCALGKTGPDIAEASVNARQIRRRCDPRQIGFVIEAVARPALGRDDGKIAGIGDHDTLMKNCPVYQEIYASQNKEVKADV